jgi:hypothetical protein
VSYTLLFAVGGKSYRKQVETVAQVHERINFLMLHRATMVLVLQNLAPWFVLTRSDSGRYLRRVF